MLEATATRALSGPIVTVGKSDRVTAEFNGARACWLCSRSTPNAFDNPKPVLQTPQES